MDHTSGDCALIIHANGETAPYSGNLPHGVIPRSPEAYAYRNKNIAIRVQDMQLVYEQLRELSRHGQEKDLSPWSRVEGDIYSLCKQVSDTIEFETVISFGHSYGAATALELAAMWSELPGDSKLPVVRAAIALDTWAWPLSEKREAQGVSVPTLMICAERWGQREEQEPRRYNMVANAVESVQRQSTYVTVKNTSHHDYNDLPFIVHPLISNALNLSASKDPISNHCLISSIILAYLKYSLSPFDDRAEHLDSFLDLMEKKSDRFENQKLLPNV